MHKPPMAFATRLKVGASLCLSLLSSAVEYCGMYLFILAVEYFSVIDQEWHTAAHMQGKRGDLAVGMLADSLFAVGGETKDPADSTCTHSVPIQFVERLMDGAGAWVREEGQFLLIMIMIGIEANLIILDCVVFYTILLSCSDIPDDLFRFVGMSYNSSNDVYKSAIYLFGGQGTYDAVNQCYPVK
jgi:hypothetical protein